MLKYSLMWLLAGVVMVVVVVFPDLLYWCAGLLGIEVASNGLFATCIFCEIVILVSLTAALSDIDNRVKILVQNVALMEQRIRILEQEFEKKEDISQKNG